MQLEWERQYVLCVCCVYIYYDVSFIFGMVHMTRLMFIKLQYAIHNHMNTQATSIGLILSSPRNRGEGDTLVVAPGHLIHQWKAEIEKFTDDIEVLVGKREYERRATLPPESELFLYFSNIFSSFVDIHNVSHNTYFPF